MSVSVPDGIVGDAPAALYVEVLQGGAAVSQRVDRVVGQAVDLGQRQVRQSETRIRTLNNTDTSV